ncbi:helicase-related protein [Azotobacter sp. CWF10]
MDGASFFQRENPFVRHVVLRKRATLEETGLLKKIAVDIHPSRELAGEHLYGFTALFEGLALRTSDDFREAYSAAVKMGEGVDNPGATAMKGFMKNLMAQRISSSIVAGIKTARKLLEGETVADEEREDEGLSGEVALDKQRDAESLYALEHLLVRLERIKVDPKFEAVKFYLDTMGWLGHGCIIFSQYYDTAQWVAESLAKHYPDEPIGLYAGAGRSRLYQQGESTSVERESLKHMVAERQLRLMVATDAACEGLNLQTLGTLINVDLPWNPTKLEQRIGRIKRFGQTRDSVDMLNLVNQETIDEKVYQRLSERMQDKFDLFGSLPDTIEADWISDIEDLGERMDAYIEKQKKATGFDLRYSGTIYPDEKGWRDCSQVFSRRDLDELMRQEW